MPAVTDQPLHAVLHDVLGVFLAGAARAQEGAQRLALFAQKQREAIAGGGGTIDRGTGSGQSGDPMRKMAKSVRSAAPVGSPGGILRGLMNAFMSGGPGDWG